MRYSIGIDVGGTNTDAVLLEFPSKRIVSSVKTPTTEDFNTGIMQSIQKVLMAQSEVTENHISSLMIGTTTFINAIVQRSPDLNPVEIIRLCGPLTRSYPPFITFPSDLKDAIKSSIHYIDGGYEYDKQLVTPLDTTKLKQVAAELLQNKSPDDTPLSIVISGIFSPLYEDQEIEAEKILREYFLSHNFTSFFITLSHKISQLGLLEREGASILNASLKSLVSKTIQLLHDSVNHLHLPNCQRDIFLTQNDGTLILCEEAIEFPIFTLNSGPSNSLRGAAFLTHVKNAFVVDVGGTTSDVAVLKNGFPRPASSYVEIGGVRTNFFLADSISIGLGGGSIVRFAEDGTCSIGPASVGYKLLQESQAFGGTILTTTDIALASGTMSLPGADISKINVTPDQIKLAQSKMISLLEEVIDKMKTSNEPIPVILVGGGSALFPAEFQLKGVTDILRPEFYQVANAIGAAITQVSASIEKLLDLGTPEAQQMISQLQEHATNKAVKKGAIRDSIEHFTEKAHLAYVPGNQFRVTCKAVGDLDTSLFASDMKNMDEKSVISDVVIPMADIKPFKEKIVPERQFNKMSFDSPKLVERDGRKEWIISEEDVECIALGAAILGAGGGGSPHSSKLELKESIRSGKEIRVISLDSLSDSDSFFYVAYYGAPLMMLERLGGSKKVARSAEVMKKLFRETSIAAVAPIEIGGLNSLVPLIVGGQLDLPVVDIDFMGRAFPEFQMTTLCIYDKLIGPCCLSDEKGNEIVLHSVQGNNAKVYETRLRKYVMDFGCDAGLCGPPISKKEGKECAVHHTLSRTWKLGRTLLQARSLKQDPLKVLTETENACLIFTGKIIDVVRVTEGGYNKGTITIQGYDDYASLNLLIDFQNENLIARAYKKGCAIGKNGVPLEFDILAVVPDLITLCNSEDYEPILTEDLRYGLRVSVISLPAHPLLTNETGLRAVGPKAFGYDVEYHPTISYVHPTGVV